MSGQETAAMDKYNKLLEEIDKYPNLDA